jgi:hypothetical protein
VALLSLFIQMVKLRLIQGTQGIRAQEVGLTQLIIHQGSTEEKSASGVERFLMDPILVCGGFLEMVSCFVLPIVPTNVLGMKDPGD